MEIHALDNEVQHYAWGSPDAIPAMLGVPNDDARPWAELWMGAHPRAPSQVTIDDRRCGLDSAIRDDPRGWLGAEVATRFGGELPFLLKLLAAGTPLSIQVHPDEDQARAGFAREEAQGVESDSAEREYPDPYPKPEVVVALQPFTALKGFREPAAIAANLAAFGLDRTAGFEAGLESLAAEPGAAGLRRLVECWLTLAGEQRDHALARLAQQAADRDDELATAVGLLLKLYPGDVGVFAPLILNLVHLAPGEGLFLDAREPHAYLSGFAIELCAASDNVLRGGLTPKHVDVPELLRVMLFEPRSPRKLVAQPGDDGLSVYPTATRFFRLSRADVTPERPLHRAARSGVEIVLCVSGEVSLAVSGGEQVRLSGGRSALIPGATAAYGVQGSGEIFVASVPPAGA